MSTPHRVGAVVYDPFTDKILLQRRKNKWACFGVNLDKERNEKPPDALRRALEMRLSLSVIDLQIMGFGAFGTAKGQLSAQYAILYHEDSNPKLLDDAERQWFTLDEIANLDDAAIEIHTKASI